MNRNNLYFEICASIDSIDENIITTVNCDDKYYYQDVPLDLNAIDCNIELCEGDIVWLHIQRPKCVYKITPYETPKEIEGKITFCSDDVAIIDEKYVCFREFFDIPMRLNGRIKAKVIVGGYLVKESAYDFRCIEITCEQEVMNEQMPRRFVPQQRRGGIFQNYYHLPDELIDAYESGNIDSIKVRLDLLMPKEDLCIENYGKKMHEGVYLEEIHMRNEFAAYRSDEACFECDLSTQRQGFPAVFKFRFHLNNEELRPRILVGDRVFAKKVNAPSICYIGKIKAVENNLFKIKFRRDFAETFNSETYIIEFRYHRTVYIKQHEAIDNAIDMFNKEFLFPSRSLIPRIPQLDVKLFGDRLVLDGKLLPWCNTQLNFEQKEAVKEALRAECRPMPFMIQGPPGTGKTLVVVETVLQLYKLFPTHRILITTQSNTAADVVASRLLQAYEPIESDLVRVISNSVHEANTTSRDLENNCACIINQIDDDEDYEQPQNKKYRVEHLKKFRIVVSTCVSIGVICRNEIDKGYFNHVIVEEAGQCEEPETLIPLSLIDPNQGQIIMSGDPMQLPPMIMSHHAKYRGYAISMFERLLNRYEMAGIASSGAVDNRLVRKLVQNYRALPEIVNFYNRLFYNSTLIPTISPVNSAEARLLREVRRQGILPVSQTQSFGLFFVDVCDGRNQRRSGSKSWLNVAEARAVRSLGDKLLKIVQQEQIGIITPYYSQVVLLKRFFHMATNVLIGSVEQLQGEERQIILISTVRTEGNPLNLRFVFCPKRLNTAVSRARSIVVVAGKATLLREDPNWREYIESCRENGTFITER